MPQLSRGRAGAEGRPKRVGHKGADALVHGNTAASFDAALAAGVDMIEFDVLPERLDGTGGLRLAHDFKDARERTPLTLDEGLAHLAQPQFAHVQLDVDMKLQGYEQRTVDALRRHGLADRSLISTMEKPSLTLLRKIAPQSLSAGLSPAPTATSPTIASTAGQPTQRSSTTEFACRGWRRRRYVRGVSMR